MMALSGGTVSGCAAAIKALPTSCDMDLKPLLLGVGVKDAPDGLGFVKDFCSTTCAPCQTELKALSNIKSAAEIANYTEEMKKYKACLLEDKVDADGAIMMALS